MIKEKILMRAVTKKIILSITIMSLFVCTFYRDLLMANDRNELIIFAAASLTEPMEEIGELYRDWAPDTDIIFNFDSSGTLEKQIEEGAECDIFISASSKQMNELEKEGYILERSRVDLLENTIVLAGSDGESTNIKSFDELAVRLNIENENKGILLAIGNSDVPAGQYALKIFEYYGLDESELATSGLLTYGSNVKEITTQISERLVDFGIIYSTDAKSAGLMVLGTASKDMCGPIIYPAAVTKTSENQSKALEFLDFLQKEEAIQVFQKAGFNIADNKELY